MIPTIPKDAIDQLRAAYPIHTQGVPVFNTSTPFVFPGSQGLPAPVPAHWSTTPLVLPSNSNSNNNTLPPGQSTPLTAAQLAKKMDLISAGFSQHVVATHLAIASRQSNPPVVFGKPQVPQPLTATHSTQTNHVGGFGSTMPQHRTGPFHSLHPPVNQSTNIRGHNAGVASRAHLPPLGGFGMPLNPVVPAQTNQLFFPPAPISAPALLAASFPLPLGSNQQGPKFHGNVILNNIPIRATLIGVSDCLDPDELMRRMRENVADLEEKYESMKETLVGDPEYEEKLREWKEKIDKQWDEIWSRLYQRHDV